MKTLELNQMELIEGGEFVSSMCIGFGTASIVAAVVASTNWWNPAGWVGAAFLIGDAACIAYGTSQL